MKKTIQINLIEILVSALLNGQETIEQLKFTLGENNKTFLKVREIYEQQKKLNS